MNCQSLSKALRVIISLALLLLGASIGCTQANSDIPSTQDYVPPIRETPLNAPELNDLLTKAQANGQVRVIVGLRVSFKPEDELANQEAVDAQRARIAQAQRDLLAQLSAYNVTNVKTSKLFPYMAMTVDVSALQYLASSPDVTSIEEDKLASPTGEQ
ncbi:MAG: hypothetical protein L6435_05490 [Anaerolineae bacterium]|nr:hypothetical protein [Anaerolineae bacterium]